MENTATEFIKNLSGSKFTHLDRAVALIWWNGLSDPSSSLSTTAIADILHEAGYPKQNISRLKSNLSRDSRTAKANGEEFRIRITAKQKLDEKLSEYLTTKIINPTNSVVPTDLYIGTRGYIEKVVKQINASYDSGLYDCTAVMCRRLLETLIIEAYESINEQDKLKNKDGNFMMFSGLLSIIENDSSLSISRNALIGLKAFKKLGDLSAHNRRFNARQSDITPIKNDLRIVSEELLHIAKLI